MNKTLNMHDMLQLKNYSLIFFFIPLLSFSQQDYVITKKFEAWEKARLEKRSPIEEGYNKINRTLEVTAWVIAPDSVPIISDNSVHYVIKEGSKYFEPIGLNFNACNINYIYDDQYLVVSDNNYKNKDNDTKLRRSYYNPKTINIYFVQIPVKGVDTVGGYAAFPEVVSNGENHEDFIVLGIYNDLPKVFAHEMGHYLGLYHTHHPYRYDGSVGDPSLLEFVDGSNCETAGDLICDTPPEPNLSSLFVCEGISAKNLFPPVDPNGDYYVPNPGNVMSYSPSGCIWGFTEGQYQRMVMIYNEFRTYLR